MARDKDMAWSLTEEGTPKPGGVRAYSYNHIHTALLMDLRDELKEVNRSLACLRCRNFLHIPAKLERIARNTKKKGRVKK